MRTANDDCRGNWAAIARRMHSTKTQIAIPRSENCHWRRGCGAL